MIKYTINDLDKWSNIVNDNNDSLIIGFFHATWCAPCRILTNTIQGMMDEYPNVILVDIDVDDDAQDMCMMMNIRSVPTLLFTKGGYISDRTTGAVGSHVIREKINKILTTK